MNQPPALERPVFIIAAPRSGSTLLFETLARAGRLWTLGTEAHTEFESAPGWHPKDRGYESNRLTASDASALHRHWLLNAFARRLRNHQGIRWFSLTPETHPSRLRFLEKTPKNSLRVSLLRALFPDARFVFLLREPRANVSSIMEAWRSGRFVTYRKLPGWSGLPWSLLLPPGWRELNGAPLERVAAFQWRAANDIALNDLASLPDADWCAVRYEDLVAAPGEMISRLCDFMDVPCEVQIPTVAGSGLPLSRRTLTPPAAGKWRTNEAAIQSVVPDIEDTWARLQALRVLAVRQDGHREPA